MKKKSVLCMLMAGIVLLSTACGKTEDDNRMVISEPLVEKVEVNSSAEKKGTAGATSSAQGEASTADAGENRIVQQIFEVELSEYEGKVYFVPFAPTEDGQDFHMQIVQDEEVLTNIEGYVPEGLHGNLLKKPFDSLDAVSFFDINYDGDTDIILIETYGGVSFAAVYYGHSAGVFFSDKACFFAEEELSENLSACVEELSIPGIRSFLSDGKRNGEFTDYREAYEAIMKFSAVENEKQNFDLIYFDEDDIPELTVGVNGYYISMYTYDDGTLYRVMDQWGYGAMGNPGYDYSPGKNSLRNYDADMAGAIMNTTYMMMNAQHEMEEVVWIVTYNSDDVNQDGSYIDGREVSQEECESYDIGGYQSMRTDKDIEEIKGLLYTK